MQQQLTTRNPPHGVLFPTMNYITELVSNSMPTALVSSLTDSPNLTLQTQKDSAWDSYQMSIVILPLKAQGNILGKVYIFIMLEEKFMLNALAMQPYLCRAVILTIVMDSIQKQFVRFLQAAH